MGCAGSKPEPKKTQSKSKQPVPSLSLPKRVAEGQPAAAANPLEDMLKDYDKRKSIIKLETHDSAEHLADGIHACDTEAALIQKQTRRRAAKLKAEAEQRWLLFSNLDTVAEADMLHVAHFMQTACANVPQLAQLMTREQSYMELNKIQKVIDLLLTG
ncbi:unnamed protein product [Sphagnum jensenii]|uniref:Uncharacterized protein n=1 Tax=Sphagnum jensenii TaxID=128206 RepID=A0ABP0VDN3_9BRYO